MAGKITSGLRGQVRVRTVEPRAVQRTVKIVRLSVKREGDGRKCQTLRGPAEVMVGRDVRLLILSGEAEIMWDAPRSVFIGDVTTVEIER